MNIPAADYYGSYATTDAVVASGLPETHSSAADAALPPRLGTEVTNASALTRLFAFQAPDYDAAFVGQSVPASMIAGRPYHVSVTMTNTGTNTWTATDLYRLGEIDNGPWSGRVHLTQAVAYGASVTFNFTVVAPSAPGTYNFQWQMVRDGARWFGAASQNVSVAVSSGSGRINVASASQGAIATAQNYTPDGAYAGLHFQPSYANDGARYIAQAGDHYWRDEHGLPSWLQIDLSGRSAIDEVDVFTLADYPAYQTQADPSPTQTFTQYGVIGFDVQYWTGSAWATVPGGSVSGNNLVWKKISFAAVTTTRIRVMVNASTDGVARIAEVEAYESAQQSGGGLPVLSLDPLSRVGEPGEDLLSRNFNWSIPLVALKGRAGLDLGVSLSYNSLVWRRDGSSMLFDEDRGDPSPGFRLGFPVIRGPFSDTNVGLQAYLLVLPSGRRVELQQLAGTNAYESIDSSYLRLTDAGGGLLYLLTPDGTQMQYYQLGGLFRCTQILDRNGNYVSINYNGAGNVSAVTDTLGRSLVFGYDANNRPLTITQAWRREQLVNGSNQVVQETHTWATFGYGTVTVNTNYPGLTLSGAQNGQTMTVLTQVGLADGTRYNFDYNTYAQIYRVTRSTMDDDGVWRPRSYLLYDLPIDQNSGAQSDCPRFTERRDWAAYWNGDSDGVPGAGEEAVTAFGTLDTLGTSGQVTTPDGTTYKEFYATAGWRRGLTNGTEFWSGGVKQKWTTTLWTQDSESISYQRNPSPYHVDVYDKEGNHNATEVNYTYYGLPDELYESGPNGVIRRTHTDYNLSPTYTDRRIVGLVSGRQLYDGPTGALQSKVDYFYDEGGEFISQQGSPVQHDNVNFGAGLVQGRGLVTRSRRYDVTDLSHYTDTVTGYNTTGSAVFSRDPMGHQTTISYADAFFNPSDPNSTIDHGTYAYPTTVTDADNYSSTVQYYYDLGAVRRARDPKGASARTYYDQSGRVERALNEISVGYTRFVYATNNTWAQSFSLVDANLPESYSIQVFNGAGAVRARAAYTPNPEAGEYRYAAQYITYDQMGRVSSQSNPHEINGNWVPAGDDAGGYLSVTQTYDWKGRPRVTTNADGTTKQVTYGGCGCAGGEVVTAQDEVGRRQRTTAGALGRVVKVETFYLPQQGAEFTRRRRTATTCAIR